MKKSFFVFILGVLLACSPSTKKGDQVIEKETTIEKKSDEYVTEYYPTGVKKVEGQLVSGERHGMWIYYYENGFIWSEGKYWHGKRKGYSLVYYKDGSKKLEGKYKDDIKVGVWKIWNEDGSLAHTLNLDKPLSKTDSLKLELR